MEVPVKKYCQGRKSLKVPWRMRIPYFRKIALVASEAVFILLSLVMGFVIMFCTEKWWEKGLMRMDARFILFPQCWSVIEMGRNSWVSIVAGSCSRQP